MQKKCRLCNFSIRKALYARVESQSPERTKINLGRINPLLVRGLGFSFRKQGRI
jgi:hypothetical protein